MPPLKRDTFKVILEEVRVLGAYFAGWPRVSRVADALGAIDAAAVPIAHLLTLGTNVHIVNGPSHRLGSSRVKSLVPPEPRQPENGRTCTYLNNSSIFFCIPYMYHYMHIYIIISVGTGLINRLILETDC